MRIRTTASALALALAIGAALPATALASPSKITTCDKLAASQELGDIDKLDGSSGTLSGDWGSVSWTSNDLAELSLEDGVTAWLCVKTGGNGGENVFDHVVVSGDDIPAALQELRYAISHVAVFIVDVDPGDPGDDDDDDDDGPIVIL